MRLEVRPLSVAEVELIAFDLAKNLKWKEKIPEFQTRYPNVLESCLLTPFVSYGGNDLYPTFIDKAAVLFYLMNKNHPFQNGNKRIAVTTLLIFLLFNNMWIDVSHDELYNIAISVAEGERTDKDTMLSILRDFLKQHIHNFEFLLDESSTE